MIEQDSSVRPPHVLSIGAFGRAVAQHLKSFRPSVVETVVTNDTVALPAIWPTSRLNIVASWRPVPHFCELLDELSYKWQRPFVPVIADSTVLRIGPVVIPGCGSCWGCWVRRSLQHDNWHEERLVVLKHYASHPNSGPQGYLEPFAMIAASRLASILCALESSTETAGDIWQIDIMTREITTGRLVGVHDCPRCGMNRPAETRTFAVMQRELAYLWAHSSKDEQ